MQTVHFNHVIIQAMYVKLMHLTLLTLLTIEKYEIFLICILNKGGRKQSNIRKAKYEKNIEKIDGKSMTRSSGSLNQAYFLPHFMESPDLTLLH